MKRTVMINQNHLFRRLYKKGTAVKSPCIAVYYRMNKSRGGNRLGITATKKIGGAVVRNRARRVIREAYRLSEARLPDGMDLVIVARTRAAQVKMQVVKRELNKLLGAVK